jgi:hypothetical protein
MSLLDQVTNEYTIEVDFTGDRLDPEKVTAIMGLQPTECAKAGDPRRNGHGHEGATYEHGFWTYDATSQDDVDECRDAHLKQLAEMVEPHVERLREAGVERIYFYYTLCSHIGLMNIHFKAETLRKVCDIGADLYVSCFDCFNPNDPIWKEDSSLTEESTNV